MAIVDEDIERLRATVSIVDVVSEVRRSCARSGATGSGCARSTPRRRRRSTSARRPVATSASAATSRGDVFTFVQETRARRLRRRRRDLAAEGRHAAHATPTRASRPSGPRRKRLVEAMDAAVEWYHERLLERPGRPRRPATTCAVAGSPATSPGSSSSAGRPTTGTRSRQGRGIDGELLRDDRAGVHATGPDRMQDAFRARVLFPIFTDNGEAVAFGGRILPGSSDPAKYKNSPETPIYAKSKTLYGLNWAKADIASVDQVDRVRGLHRRDRVPPRRRAAGGGHVRHRVHRGARAAAQALRQPGRAGLRRRRGRPGRGRAVLRVGAEVPGAGVGGPPARRQGPRRAGPARPGRARRGRRRRGAVPRVPPARGSSSGRPARTPEERARLAERAMAVVNEHPDVNVRKLYAGEVASAGRPAGRRPRRDRRAARRGARSLAVAPRRAPGRCGERRVRRHRAARPATGTRSPGG